MFIGAVFGWVFAALALGNAANTSPSSELSASEFDVPALNGCIVDAIGRGESWPSNPVVLVRNLFDVNAECVRLGSGDAVLEDSPVDSTATVVFRHTTSGSPSPNHWLEVSLRVTPDGTLRVQTVDLYEKARVRAAERQLEKARRQRLSRGGFDSGSGNPLDLLEFLQLRPGCWIAGLFPRDWVKEIDLPTLMEKIDSDAPCANVTHMLSSFIDTSTSTVGNEAAYLIEGYRSGEYPPRLNSIRPRPDVEGIKKWWRQRNGT